MTVAHSPRFVSGRRTPRGRRAAIAAFCAIVAPILFWQPRSAVAQSDGDKVAVALIQAEQTEQRGQLDLRDIDLAMPVLASLLRLAPPPNDSSARGTVTLYRLRMDFQRSPDKLVVRNGVACHADFALTFDGYASLPAGELHFNGVLWPAIDPAGLIPIMGALTKRNSPTLPPAEHRGVFPPQDPDFVPIGLSYALSGSSSAPQLQINPFADVFPGSLRRVSQTCQPDAGGG